MTLKRFGFGLDLGEIKDFTALAAAEIDLRRHGRPFGRNLAPHRPYYDFVGLERTKADQRESVLVPYRVEGDHFYDSVCRWVGEVLSQHPFFGNSFLMVDTTGLELIEAHRIVLVLANMVPGLPIYPLQIRKLNGRVRQVANGIIQISRADLLTTSALVMEQGRVTVNADLELAPMLKNELLGVTKNPTPPREEQESWRVGLHDDLALAACSVIAMAEQLAGQGVGGIVPVRWK